MKTWVSGDRRQFMRLHQSILASKATRIAWEFTSQAALSHTAFQLNSLTTVLRRRGLL